MKPKFLIPFCIIYLLVLALEIYAEYDYVVTQDLTFLSIMQPLLVPGLIIYLIYNCKGKFNRLSMWVLAGLSFDWISDIILTLYYDAFNLPTVLGYFAGHICYSVAFASSIKKSGYKILFINRLIFSLPPLLYIVVYYFFIYNYMSTHEVNSTYIVPISLYVISILIMTTTALWRMGTTNDTSYWLITSGALLYMLSDSLTGYHLFVEPLQLRYIATMFPYGVALLLFTIGTILHKPILWTD